MSTTVMTPCLLLQSLHCLYISNASRLEWDETSYFLVSCLQKVIRF